MINKIISEETAKDLSSKMLNSITIQNGIHLADRRRIPSIGFYEDENQFFDPSSYSIHLGIYGPIKIFKVETEEDYVAALEYFYGHENQHVRSTAKIPYDNGIKRAAKEVVQFIAAKEGIRKNFRNDKDYEVFLKSELPSAKGIRISFNMLCSICAVLMNSVEDGRIERIRSLEFPGFEKQRRYFRAIVWDVDREFKPYDVTDFNEEDKLNLFMSCILSLATTGLYPKGFVTSYFGTPLIMEVQKFMPFIAKGVLSRKTRYMADNVVELAKLLAPYIYWVCKNAPTPEEQLQQMLSKLLSQLISQMDPDKMADTSEREEEEDDGQPLPVFPQSDLTITLDDDEYDKLMKNNGNKNKSGVGIMVKRKNPKENSDENGQNDMNGNGNGDKKEDASDTDKDSSGNKSSGDSKGNKSASNSSSSNSGKYEKKYSYGEGGASDSENSSGSHSAGGGRTCSVEMVKKQMKKAAKECRDDVTDKLTTINQSIEHTAKTNRGCAPVTNNFDKPVTKEAVKEIMKGRGFEELRREYKLSEKLPPVLDARAKAFRKKNERYFRSLSTPNVSHLDSGGVDPSLIYGLAMGDTDIFRKVGQDKKFDGCVYVLVDNSGSMAGNKRTEAAKAAAIIEEGFKGIIPMKIVAFDTCGKVIHEVIKGWDESQKLNCCWNFAKLGRSGCGNDDSYDILVAQKELLARPEEKKLLIVLSDGAPASVEATKTAIQDTRKKGINVFGLYFEEGQIGSDAKEFRYMYQKDYVCCELDELDNELTKLMIRYSRS